MLGGDHDRDPGPEDALQAPDVEEARGEHGARVPRRHDRIGLPVGDGANGPDERRVRLAANGLGRLVVHLDDLGRDDVVEAVRLEVGGPVDDRADLGGRGGDGACDDLVRGTVAPEGVHGDPEAHGATVRAFRAAGCHGPGTSCRWGRRDVHASASRSSGTR